MILKKQLLTSDNLNAAFISKTDTAEQSTAGYLKLGGKLTLKTGGSQLSDDFNATYMQIDPQGSHLVLYDGANDMRLSVYASNGAKSTYLTTNDAANSGILDVQGVARIHIAPNSVAPVLFGGNIMLNNGKSIQATDGTNTKDIINIFGMNVNGAGLVIGAGGATILGAGEAGTTLLNGLGVSYSTEAAYITADQNIYLFPGQNSGWNGTSFVDIDTGKIALNGSGGTRIDIADTTSYAQIILRATTSTTERKWAIQANESDGTFRINEDATTGLTRLFIYEGGMMYHPTGIMRTDGTIQVGNAGGTLNVGNGGDFNFKSGVLFGQYSSNRVGINTNAPRNALDVKGGVIFGTNGGYALNDGGLSLGDITLEYSPTSANWNTSGTTLALNGLTYSTIGFHDAGSRVDFIRAGAGTITLGYDGGFGAAAISVPGNLSVTGTTTLTGGLSMNNTISYNDVSRYWLVTASSWGIYWDTTSNEIEFHGSGVSKFSVDLDNGNTVVGGALTVNGGLDMNGYNINAVGTINIADPGPSEGIVWGGGNGWQIFESPDDWTTNGAGNLQFGTTARKMTLYATGNLNVTNVVEAVGGVYIGNSSTALTKSGSGDALRIQTTTGYIDIGSMNASYAHMYTDRPSFYMNKDLYVNGNRALVIGDTIIANDGAGIRSIRAGTSDYYSISLDSHSNATWFRNVVGNWTFQAGSSSDQWTSTFAFYLPPAGATVNAVWAELGQRSSNEAGGRYRGVAIKNYTASTVVDGDLKAGAIYAVNALVVPVGTNRYTTVAS